MVSSRWFRPAVATMLGIAAASTASRAQSIDYSLSFGGSGTLGSQSFTDRTITLSLTADAADVMSGDAGYDYYTPATTLAVSVSGLGMVTSIDEFIVEDSHAMDSLSYVDVYHNNSSTDAFVLAGIGGPAFLTYDLTTPLTVYFDTIQLATGVAFPTTGGDFTIISTTNTSESGVFTTTIASVPEPATLAMCGTAAAAGLAVWMRRRSSRG